MPVASVGTLAVGTVGTLACVGTLLSRLKELSGTLASVGPEVPVVSQLSS